MPLTELQQQQRDALLRTTIERLLDHARDLAKLDKFGSSSLGVYHSFAAIGQSLGGLKNAIEAYDTTVEYFDELAAEPGNQDKETDA